MREIALVLVVMTAFAVFEASVIGQFVAHELATVNAAFDNITLSTGG